MPSAAGGRPPFDRAKRRGGRPRLVGLAAGLVVALGLLLTSCYPGTYPFDVFPEMHYQPSFRPYEPPRLSAPESSVATDGRRNAVMTDFAAATDLRNPIQPSPEATQRATQLFQINCRACHGPEGRGNGIVAQYFQRAQVTPPVDFAGARARSRTDGQLFFYISNGIGNMPSFRNLLTEEERWYLVLFVRNVQAQNPPS